MGKVLFFLIVIAVIFQFVYPQLKAKSDQAIGNLSGTTTTTETVQNEPIQTEPDYEPSQIKSPYQDPENKRIADEAYKTGMDLYYGRNGQSKEYSAAFGYIRKASDLGHPDAQIMAANMMFNGIGTPANVNEAIQLFQKSASMGNKEASVRLAEAYMKNKQFEPAADLMKKESDNNNPMAQVKLGEMYLQGKGVERNPQEALALFKKSASVGNTRAMFKLGEMYYKGNGVKRNYNEAFKLFLKAGNKGDKDAAYNLAEMYADGIGTEVNKTEAIRWFNKSGRKGAFIP